MGDQTSWEGVASYGNGTGGSEPGPYMYHYAAQPEGAQSPQQPQRGEIVGQPHQLGLENEKQQPSPQPTHLQHQLSQQPPQSPQQQQPPPWDNSKEKGPTSYEGGALPPAPHPQMQVCRHFLQGRCAFGYNCRFSHTVDPSTMQQPTGMVPPDASAGGGSAMPQQPQGAYGVPQDYYYNQNPYQFAPYYGYPGYYGAVATHQAYAGHYGYGGFSPMGISTTIDHTSAGKTRIPCRFFRQGICKYGGECRFSHEL